MSIRKSNNIYTYVQGVSCFYNVQIVIEFVPSRHYLTSTGVTELVETFKFYGGHLGDQGGDSIMG